MAKMSTDEIRRRFPSRDPLWDATLNMRDRTGRDNVGTQIGKGKYQVVTVDYPPEKRGRSVVKPISGWLSYEDAVVFMDNLQKEIAQ